MLSSFEPKDALTSSPKLVVKVRDALNRTGPVCDPYSPPFPHSQKLMFRQFGRSDGSFNDTVTCLLGTYSVSKRQRGGIAVDHYALTDEWSPRFLVAVTSNVDFFHDMLNSPFKPWHDVTDNGYIGFTKYNSLSRGEERKSMGQTLECTSVLDLCDDIIGRQATRSYFFSRTLGLADLSHEFPLQEASCLCVCRTC